MGAPVSLETNAPDANGRPSPISATNPLPIGSPDITVSGTISARNTVQAGVAPAGSALAINASGRATVAVQISANTLSQPLVAQATLDGVTWFTLGGTPLLAQSSGALIGNQIPAGTTGIFSLSAADFLQVRLSTVDAVVAGSAAVVMETSAVPAIVAIDGGAIGGSTGVAPGVANINRVTTVAVLTQLEKATAGTLFELSISNTTAALVVVRLYNKASTPVPASDVPVFVVAVAAGATVAYEFGQNGKRFPLGIGIGITGAVGDTDATVPAAGAKVHGTFV